MVVVVVVVAVAVDVAVAVAVVVVVVVVVLFFVFFLWFSMGLSPCFSFWFFKGIVRYVFSLHFVLPMYAFEFVCFFFIVS